MNVSDTKQQSRLRTGLTTEQYTTLDRLHYLSWCFDDVVYKLSCTGRSFAKAIQCSDEIKLMCLSKRNDKPLDDSIKYLLDRVSEIDGVINKQSAPPQLFQRKSRKIYEQG